MAVTETLGALGGWTVQLREDTPDYLVSQIGFFGHIAIADGRVDVDAVGQNLLTRARYVGVLREKDKATGRNLSGSGMLFWLGDEDGKGDVLEAAVTLTNATFTAAVTAIVGPSPNVTVGTIHPIAGTYSGKHQFQTRREALAIICDAFGAEFRVNGDGSVDAGTPAQLYNTEAPGTIIVRKGAGSDMDLVALGGDYEVGESVHDYSTRVVLLGQTVASGDEPEQVFATGSADAPTVPYLNLRGTPVKIVRPISESGTTTGSVAARAQLQLNRFNRATRSLKVTARDYETDGRFVVGDNVFVYDPDTGIVNPAIERSFRGEILHPDVVRASGITWAVVEGMTVAFRTHTGVWLDLTPYVVWETGGDELAVGDLPKSLTRPSDNPIQVRLDAVRGDTPATDTTTPNAPTGLTLTTSSAINVLGETVSVIHVAWTAPTLNTDGSVLTDLSHYVVQYRWTARAPQWQQANATDTTELDLTVTPSLPHDVQVTAYDIFGNASEPTPVVSVVAAADSIAPNAPADPVVTSYLGQLRIEYVGTDSGGQPMAADTNRIDVHVGTTSTFTATDDTRVASLTPQARGVAYATAPYGEPRYVRLIAVDHDGNESASSAVVSGATVQVGNGDIASMSIGKLTFGTATGDFVVAGRFTTALTGARRELNAIGFQAWDAANALTISLDGVNNLLTGRFRTALTGRRIELGAAGASGALDFFAPDGTNARVQAFTSSYPNAGVEAMSLRIPVANTYPAWNSLQIQNNQNAYLATNWVHVTYGGDASTGAFRVAHARDRGTAAGAVPVLDTRLQIDETYGTIMYDNGNRLRLWMTNDGGFQLWDGDDINNAGDQRFVIANDYTNIYNPAGPNNAYQNQGQIEVRRDQTIIRGRPNAAGDTSYTAFRESGAVGSSVRFYLVNRGGYGGMLKYWYVEGDGGEQRLEIRNNFDNGFIPVWAWSFVVNSDRAAKTDIRDLDFSPLATVKKLRPRRYAQKREPGAPRTPDLLGFVADEMPTDLLVGDPASEYSTGIDVMGVITTLVGAVQQLAAEIDAMREGKK